MSIFKTIGKQSEVTPATLGITGVGALATRNASGQFVGLGPGADGQVLVSNSGEVTGLSWSTLGASGANIHKFGSAIIVGSNQTLTFNDVADIYVLEVMLTANAEISLGTPSGSPDYARLVLAIEPTTNGVTPTLGQSGATIKTPNGDQPLISEVSGDTSYWIFEWTGSQWVLVNTLYNVEAA